MLYKKVLNTISQKIHNIPLLRSAFHRCGYILFSCLQIIPDKQYAKLLYHNHTGQRLELDNPTTFNDKLWWLKLHNRDPLLTKCTDKFTVRDYVEKCGYGDILTHLYGTYTDAEQIDFTSFQTEVFLKCNHGSGTNMIYAPGQSFDRKRFVRNFNFDLRHNQYPLSREWNYKNIKPLILCEEVLRNEDGTLPKDYKFMCFGGVPKLLFLEGNVCDEHGRRNNTGSRFVNVYDMNFELTPIISGASQNTTEEIEPPVAFDRMKEIAAKLSSPFPLCRVDLYCVKGKVFFGEMTFYHGGGCVIIQPPEWAAEMGNWVSLETVKT